MKFLIDNNLSYKLIGHFSTNFPDSVHVRTVLSVGADDGKIWRYPNRNGYVILTKDNDFDEFTQLYGCPPKVVHLVCGNRTTLFIADLVLAHKKEIIDFGTSDPESCLLKIVG